ncbi:MAG TPA: cytochrome c-type biogenesis protein CcmH [Gaiellaceae bacterium]
MKRLAAAALAALVLAPAALASEQHPTQRELERELVCIECHTTLDESDSAIARQMKAYIARRIRQGATKSQIEDELVDQFGPGVLGVPRKHGFDLLAWVLPLGGIALGAVALGVGARRWSRVSTEPRTGRGSVKELPLDPEDERRVDEELERFE